LLKASSYQPGFINDFVSIKLLFEDPFATDNMFIIRDNNFVETDKVDNEKEKDEYRAQEIIISTLSEKVTNYIINCKSAREIWIKILSIFEQDDMIKKHSDQQKFFNYKYESKGIAHHISELENVADDLKRRGETISEELLITKILMTLPAQYSNFQTVWEGTPNEMKNLKRLTERLCSEESRIKMYEDGPTSHQEVGAAFISKVKCFRCGKQGHIKKDCKVRDPKSKTELAGKPKFCSHCRKKGHTIDTCWYSKTNKKKVTMTLHSWYQILLRSVHGL
jgi:Zinc knuckle.